MALLAFTIISILTINFAIFQFLPGDPTMIYIDSGFSQEMVNRQKELWGLTEPAGKRYVTYLKNMLSFDFGQSFFQGDKVSTILAGKLVNTFLMIAPALLISIVFGTVIGAIAGWRRGTKFEQVTVGICLFLHSVPSFFVGILVLMVFAYQLRWVPSGGIVSFGGVEGFWPSLTSWDFWLHWILPGLVLVSREVTGPILILRSSMIDVKGSDFLEVLRAKGLPEAAILVHATRNALLPLLTYFAVMLGGLFQGQVLLETIFSWPGIGRELVKALGDLDYPVAQAALFVMALAILVCNFLADLAYRLVDPRVAYD